MQFVVPQTSLWNHRLLISSAVALGQNLLPEFPPAPPPHQPHLPTQKNAVQSTSKLCAGTNVEA